jgi:hypothetical protein
MDKMIFEGNVEYSTEEGGQALILELDDGRDEPGPEPCVTLSSYTPVLPGIVFFNRYDVDDIRSAHPVLGRLIGQRVRITVEVLS